MKIFQGNIEMTAQLAIFILLIINPITILSADEPARTGDIRDMLGVTHACGKYCLTEKDFLNEGADQVLAVGSRVIKLWFNGKPENNYPFHSSWPRVTSLADLAKTKYSQDVFSKPFTTYVLETFSVGIPDNYWKKQPTEQQFQEDQRQFYELTKYLLVTYRNTGKTFVLQNWEGDWAVMGFDPKISPAPDALAGMIRWLNARQAGVDQARAEIGQQGVRVLHAAEVNRVFDSMEKNLPRVVDKVLPFVKVDLVSYSSYDTQQNPEKFKAAIKYIASHMREGFQKTSNVYIGEFGLPENKSSQEKVHKLITDVVRITQELGCPYAIYWQVYCNEPINKPVKKNEDTRGFWLVRPDGTKSWAWESLKEILTRF